MVGFFISKKCQLKIKSHIFAAVNNVLFMKRFALIIGISLLILLAASCKKDRTCQCTASQGQEMIDLGYFTGKKSCDIPEKETQGYEGWVIKCVEIEVDENINQNTN